MKSRTKIILVIIILTALFILVKDWLFKDNINIEKVEPVIQIQKEELVVSGSFEAKTLNQNDPYVKFDIKYPYFKNADKDFNIKIEKFITDQIPDFIASSKENWQARYDTQEKGGDITKLPQKDEDKFYFFSDFNIVQSNSKYISFVLIYGGFNGGAHGYENKISFNYDVKNQKNIELKDLFINNPDYLNYLSAQSRDLLKKQDFAVLNDEDKKSFENEESIKEYEKNVTDSIDSGTEPKEENFSVFTFVENKIKIYFGQYQVGSYAIGMPEVEIDIK